MGIKVKDYIMEINRQKEEAAGTNKTLTIRAGDLHSKLRDKTSPSLVQCCSALRQCMLRGDEILRDKENKTGASAELTIRYDLRDLDKREKLFEEPKRGRPKGSVKKDPQSVIAESESEVAPVEIPVEKPKRGRPKGSVNKKKAMSELLEITIENQAAPVEKRKRGRPKGSVNKKKTEVDTTPSEPKRRGRPPKKKELDFIINRAEAINTHFEEWMKQEKIRFQVYKDYYLINDGYGPWIISKFQDESASERFLTTIRMMDEQTHKLSVIFEDNTSSRYFWDTMSEEVIDRLNATAYFVGFDGTVRKSM